MNRLASAVLVFCLSGCSRGHTSDSFPNVLWEHFPFDGNRTWVFRSHEPGVPDRLHVTSFEEDRSEVDGVPVYRVDMRRCQAGVTACRGPLVRSWLLSSTVEEGVHVHELAAGGARAVYERRIQIVESASFLGEGFETRSSGHTWTSELQGYQSCADLVWLEAADFERANCMAVFELTTTAEASVHRELTGQWFVARAVGFVGFALDADDGALWGLESIDCDPIESCDGDW